MNDGQFTYDEERDAFVCSQETFDWWDKVIDAHQSLEYKIQDLKAIHGADAVAESLQGVDTDSLEDAADNINKALDEAFNE